MHQIIILIEGLLLVDVYLYINWNRDYKLVIRRCGLYLVPFVALSLSKDVKISVTIKNSTISHAKNSILAPIRVGFTFTATDLLIEDSVIFKLDKYALTIIVVPNVTIVNSNISYINGFGIVAYGSNITLQNCSIDNTDFGVMLTSPRDAQMIEVSFTQNRFFGICLLSISKIIFRDCTFDNNNGTPIIAHQSTFQLSGKNVFSNNIAIRGGGLALYQSTVTFDSGSTTRFENKQL